MSATTGLATYGTYTAVTVGTATLTDVTASITSLTALIPDPDTAPAQGGGGHLDEMNPGAAAQIRAELAALQASITA